jgi:hypothetical protein
MKTFQDNQLLMTMQLVSFEEVLESKLRTIIREEYEKMQKRHEEKLLTAKQACQMFQPAITTVTLNSWTKKGLIQKHYIGRRPFFKSTDIINAATTLTKYKRTAV